MKKERFVYATLEEADIVEKTLREIKSENISNSNLNLGIFYGLVLGIIGNLFVTVLFDYVIKDLSEIGKSIIFAALFVIVVFFLIIISEENKKASFNQEKINNHLDNIEIIKEKIKKGEKVPKRDLLDNRNVVEKAKRMQNLKNPPS